jgi:DNA uptake protein ComE-like DNA-binding protein
LSVTQTGRVLAFRERSGSFSSLDDLDEIPGFPRALLDEIKRHLTL